MFGALTALAVVGCAGTGTATTAAALQRTAGAAVRPGATNRRSTLQVGVASWHGPRAGSAGSRTASHRRWDCAELVAAHRTLPLGSRVSVVNLDNDRRVDVQIIDRGPYVHGRIIDVSPAVARELNMFGRGVAHVRLETTLPPAPAPADRTELAVPAALVAAALSPALPAAVHLADLAAARPGDPAGAWSEGPTTAVRR